MYYAGGSKLVTCFTGCILMGLMVHLVLVGVLLYQRHDITTSSGSEKISKFTTFELLHSDDVAIKGSGSYDDGSNSGPHYADCEPGDTNCESEVWKKKRKKNEKKNSI